MQAARSTSCTKRSMAPSGPRAAPISRRVAHTRRCLVVTAVQAAATPPAIPINPSAVQRVKLATQRDCELGVSIYPVFAYNALGGGGWGRVEPIEPGMLRVEFDAETVIIPPLNWKTATLFGVPIPPPLNIQILPSRLEGTINTQTGEMLLEFDANFIFTVGSLYKAPPLVVRTKLTTGHTKGRFREGTGARFVGSKGKLAGTATVEKTGDWFMDSFLFLPTDALAVMSAELLFE